MRSGTPRGGFPTLSRLPIGAVIGILAGAGVVVATVIVLFPDKGGKTPPSAGPAIRLEATYAGHLSCDGSCTGWEGGTKLEVEIPRDSPKLADAVIAELEKAGWQDGGEVSGQPGATITHTLERNERHQARAPSAGLWPVAVVHRIPMPAELDGRAFEVALMPEDRREWMPSDVRSRLDSPRPRPVSVYLEPAEDSQLELRYPRLAVEASTPASEAQVISAGRDERRIDVSDPDSYDSGAVTLDVLALRLRAAGVADALALRHTGWVWTLIIIPVGAFVLGVFRRRADDAADGLFDRLFRRRRRSKRAEG